MAEKDTHCCPISITIRSSFPSSFEENLDLPLTQLLVFEVLSFQPPVQISDQSNLLPTIWSAVTLLRNQGGKAVDVLPQWIDAKSLQVFGLWIKTNDHGRHSFLGLRLRKESTPGEFREQETKKGRFQGISWNCPSELGIIRYPAK